jgi:PadR family transcriptional regulator PadR
MRNPRLTHRSLRVLRLFLDAHPRELAGADIIREGGISAGTLYPLLERFERQGIFESRWEVEEPYLLGRPRRRFYRLTSRGMALAHAELSALAPSSAAAIRPIES